MKWVRLFVISLLGMVLLIGCGSEKHPENVIAVVNGKYITVEDVERELMVRELFIEIYDALNQIYEIDDQREALLEGFGLKEGELTPEQERYFEDLERSTTKKLTENEAFNILLREEVLYQEAVRFSHDVTEDWVKEVFAESDEINREVIESDEESKEFYNKYVEVSTEIYNKYGFASEEDYFSQRVDRLVYNMATNKLQFQFENAMADKITDSHFWQIELANAWGNYSEYLIDKAKVKILKPEFSFEKYGQPWNYGDLDLKSLGV
ncbi:MAG: hypothetical protein GX958_00905 [Desulfitobacterium sp.]|nr:hypothetical protein [Desulfitobacterium sp.]